MKNPRSIPKTNWPWRPARHTTSGAVRAGECNHEMPGLPYPAFRWVDAETFAVVIRAARISVMVAGLEEINSIPADLVPQPVLLRNPPRPAAGEHELQRFRLADAGERIPHYRFY